MTTQKSLNEYSHEVKKQNDLWITIIRLGMFYRLRFMFRVVYYVLFTGMSSKTSILLESFKFIEMVPYRHEQSSFDLIFKGQETVGTLYHTIDEIYPLIVPL